MFPWVWFHWSPQVQFPFSGAVTQDIDAPPVQAGSGNPEVEREIGRLASYGRQLGWLSEVVLGQQPDATPSQRAAVGDALGELRELAAEVAAIKRRNRDARLRAAARMLQDLAQDEPEALAEILGRLSVPQAKRLPPATQPRR